MELFRVLSAFLGLTILTSGCATTKAYERELLADPIMMPDEAEAGRAALRAHFLGTREGAVGSFGGAGGGCGCN